MSGFISGVKPPGSVDEQRGDGISGLALFEGSDQHRGMVSGFFDPGYGYKGRPL